MSVTGPKSDKTSEERTVVTKYAELFANSPDPLTKKLESFPKYIRRQDLSRLLARYELFTRILEVKGSIIECGVEYGAGLMTWANLSAALEPVNFSRRIYGLDTFEGFPSISQQDVGASADPKVGQLKADSYDELTALIETYDKNRFLGHMPKVELVKGDAVKTIPALIDANRQLVVSLLYLDFDLYEPTRVALEHFMPRMPKGAVLAFDELDSNMYPGETQAALETVGLNNLRLQRFQFEPEISFAVME